MSNFKRTIARLAATFTVFSGSIPAMAKEQWIVPLGGNSYLTSSDAGSLDRVEASGIKQWSSEKSVFSIYFSTDRAAVLDLDLRLKVPEGESVIRATSSGRVFETKITGAGVQDILLGKISTPAAGYVRVDLQGLRKTGAVFADVGDLVG